MESLETKLERLSLEQRKETEDFVDFLLSRSMEVPARGSSNAGQVPVQQRALPPLILNDPVGTDTVFPQPANAGGEGNPGGSVSEPFHEISPDPADPLTPDYLDYGKFADAPSPATEAVKKVKRRIIARESGDKPRHLLDWVD